MMSMRLRLSLTIGSAFVLVWALAAAWMLSDLRQQMMFSLDQRLVASARMVAGLLEQLPQLPVKGEGTHFSAEQLTIPGGMACQVSSLRGEILARSHNNPSSLYSTILSVNFRVPQSVTNVEVLENTSAPSSSFNIIRTAALSSEKALP